MNRTVDEVMTRRVVTIGPQVRFKDIVEALHEHRVSALPVLDVEGGLVGIVSEADLLLKEERGFREPRRRIEGARRRQERAKARAVTAAQVMTKPVITVKSGTSIGEAARIMHRQGVKRLVVVDETGRTVGVVSRRDILRIFLRDDEEIVREVMGDVIEGTLWLEPGVVEVSVQDGVVTLRGELDRRSLCDILLGLVKRIDGVVGLDNRLSYRFDDLTARRSRHSNSPDVLPDALRL